MHAYVAEILERRGYKDEARKLTLVSKGGMVEYGKMQFGLSLIKSKIAHPLQALQDTMCQPWRRRCVSYAIIQQGHLFLPKLTLQGRGNMKDFMSIYRDDMKGKLQLAMEKHPDAPFTFHFVYRFQVDPSRAGFMDEKRMQKILKDQGGEMAVHRFICLPNLVNALHFFHKWTIAQSSAVGKTATCLMECGPPDDSISRKWIIDVDAAFQDLKALGFLADPSICSEEVPNYQFRA